MTYSLLLFAHIAGGIITGLVASYAGVIMWRGASSSYRMCALILGGLATYQILSGVALAFLSSTISARALCANIVVYLSVVTLVEALLFIQMRKVSLSYPLLQTISPVMVSLLVFAAAIGAGV